MPSELRMIDSQLEQLIRETRHVSALTQNDLHLFIQSIGQLQTLFTKARNEERAIFIENGDRTDSPNFIAGLIHKCGTLAVKSRQANKTTQLSITHLGWLLWLLMTNDGDRTKAKHVSMILNAIGKLAEADLLTGQINAAELQESFHKFNERDVYDSQAIAMGLYGVGQMTAKKHLLGQFNAKDLTKSLIRLHSCPSIEARHISSSFKGLTQLAIGKGLNGTLAVDDLKACFNKLMQCDDCDAQSIGMSLQAIGHLATEQAILGQLTVDEVVNYVERFMRAKHPDSQGMSMVFHGLGQLAEAGTLSGKLPVGQVKRWLDMMLTFADFKLLHTCICLFALGQLGWSEQLEGQFKVRELNVLLNPLTQDAGWDFEIGAKEIGNVLCALGRLANANALEDSFDVKQLAPYLERLLRSYDVDAQAIKMGLLGLGQLAGAGKLTGQFPIMLLRRCMIKLVELIKDDSRPNAYQEQHLSNSIYAIGLLALAQLFTGQFDFAELQVWLKYLRSLPHLSDQGIAMSFQGIELISASGHLGEGQFRTDELKDYINLLFSLPAIHAQSMSVMIHALGYLTDERRMEGSFHSDMWKNCLDKMMHCDNVDDQNISVFLYALGQLSLITEVDAAPFDIAVFRLCFQKLMLSHSLNAQALSNSLFGVSGWVRVHGLSDKFTVAELKSYLDVLMTCPDCNPLAIALGLYALGQLAASGAFEVINLTIPLARLANSPHATKSQFSMALYGLGQLAAEGQLVGHIDMGELQAHFEMFAKLPDVDDEWLGIGCYSLANLVSAKVLTGEFSLENVRETSANLLNSASAQAISMYFYGLSQMATAEFLTGGVDVSELTSCLTRLLSQQDALEAQHISMLLYGLGQLAAAKQLRGEKLNSDILRQCLARLVDMPSLHAQAISNSLYGLAQLADHDWLLPNALDVTTLQLCFDRLVVAEEPSAQAINNSLFALKQFLHFNILARPTDLPILLTGLITSLNDMVQSKSESPYRARNAFLLVAAVVEIAPGAIDLATPSQETEALLVNLISLGLSGNYVHPSEAAQMVHAIVSIGRIYPMFDNLLRQALSAITVPVNRLAQPLQAQLQQDLDGSIPLHPWYELLQAKIGPDSVSDDRPDDSDFTWNNDPSDVSETDSSEDETDVVLTKSSVAMLSTARTTPSTSTLRRGGMTASSIRHTQGGPRALGLPAKIKQEAMVDVIFETIFKENEHGLKTLLGLLHARLVPAPNVNHKRERYDRVDSDSAKRQRTRTGTNDVPRLQRDASGPDKLVRDFFERTPRKAMIALVEQRNVNYFCLLLRACSVHQRYQLAINHDLHLLLIHMPIKNVKHFIGELIKPCHIYVDHRALLAVLDALNLRRLENTTEQAKIMYLQQRLLEEGLRHHESHKRVAPRLVQAKRELDTQEITLWYEDVDTRIGAQQQSVSQRATFDIVKPESTTTETKTNLVASRGKPSPGFAIRGKGLLTPGGGATPREALTREPLTKRREGVLLPEQLAQRGEDVPLPRQLARRGGLFSPLHRGSSSSQCSPQRSSTHASGSADGVTLGNGDCLYNSVAKGIKRNAALQKNLFQTLSRVVWSDFVRYHPRSELARQNIHQLSSDAQMSLLNTFLAETFSLDSGVIQKRLAPMLRYITVNYLKFHFGKPGLSLFSNDVLSELVNQYQDNPSFRDEMHLLYHEFIQIKLTELMTSHPQSDVPQAFATWFEDEGKNQYLREIQKPAQDASDKARWGAEIEADALARLLETSFTWEKHGASNQIGILSGIVRSERLGEALTDKLIRLNIAEPLSLRSSDNEVRVYLRFKQNARELLTLHTGDLLLPNTSHCEATILTIYDGWRAAQKAQHRLTVYGYIRMPEHLNQQELGRKFLKRGILKQDGYCITDSQGGPDLARMVALAEGLDSSDAERLTSIVGVCHSSMTLRFNDGHWSYVSPALTDESATSTSRVLHR